MKEAINMTTDRKNGIIMIIEFLLSMMVVVALEIELWNWELTTIAWKIVIFTITTPVATVGALMSIGTFSTAYKEYSKTIMK